MENRDLDRAFSLSAQLIQQQTYHNATDVLLKILSELENIISVSSYEIFGNLTKVSQTKQKEYLIRRYPISLQEQCNDEKIALITPLLQTCKGDVIYFQSNQKDWILLDVYENVRPRRCILLEGNPNQYDRMLIDGLHSIYTKQIAVLDTKERDPLTHLLNRECLHHILGKVFDFYANDESARQLKGSWLAILDIDHFKKVNDQYGHLFGDEVLLHFANLMEQFFHFSDYIFRYGGEEFIVILNNHNQKEAHLALETFRTQVEAYPFPSGNISTSIGYSKLNPKKPPFLLIEEADQALYHAKAMGRNQTVLYNENIKKERYRNNIIELF